MKTKTLFFGILLFVVFACSKDDGAINSVNVPDSGAANQAPGAFALLEVRNNATNVELFPTLTWNTATDPDGDQVTYDVYLDSESDPKTKVASDLRTTTFTLTRRLDWALDYYWKVIAKDNKGAETQSNTVNLFKTRPIKVTTLPPDKDFIAGLGHEAIVFNNQIWVIGGYNEHGGTNVVLSSDDGLEWNSMGVPENINPPFNAKIDVSLAVFQDSLWIIAGTDGIGAAEREVWRGDGDKDHWEFVGNGAFSGRYLHTSVVFQDKLWVLAGLSGGDSVFGDIWHSPDGETWQENNPSDEVFSPRFGHTTVVFDNKLWLIGGRSEGMVTNDIWSSPDGLSWTKVEPVQDNLFEPRAFHDCLVYDNKLWIIGGITLSGNLKDIWYSEDGVDWVNATPEEGLSTDTRFGSTVVFENKMYNITGQGFINIFDDPDATITD